MSACTHPCKAGVYYLFIYWHDIILLPLPFMPQPFLHAAILA